MKNGSIIKTIFGFLMGRGMGPLALALGEFDKIGDGLRRVLFKQAQTMVPSLVSNVAYIPG